MAKVKKRKVKRRPASSVPQPERAEDRANPFNRRERKDYSNEFNGSTVLKALNFFEKYAEQLPVTNLITSETETLPVYRFIVLAELLGVTYQTLWRWTSETHLLPRPVLVDNTTGREYPVYHLEEVRVMITVIGQHLRGFKYYRKDHEATKRKLFGQIDVLRAQNFGNKKGRSNGNQTQGKSSRPKIRRTRKRR